MSDSFDPRPEHKFSFGLWTISNRGRDPFGDVVRPVLTPVDAVGVMNERYTAFRRLYPALRTLHAQTSFVSN